MNRDIQGEKSMDELEKLRRRKYQLEARLEEVEEKQQLLIRKREAADQELHYMMQFRDDNRARQCRKMREGEHRILIRINWPVVFIGSWLYAMPFLFGFAAVLAEKIWP